MYIIFSLSWSYGSWIYNYLCNKCLSSLKVWIRFPLMARCTRYNIMWLSWSVTCDRSVVLSGYSTIFYQYNWRHENNSNIVESGVKHNNHTTSYALIIICESSSLHISLYISSHHNSVKAGWDFFIILFK